MDVWLASGSESESLGRVMSGLPHLPSPSMLRRGGVGEALLAPPFAGSLPGDLADCARDGRWNDGQRAARRLLRADLESVGRGACFYLVMARQLFDMGENIPSRRAVAFAVSIDPSVRRELEGSSWAANFLHYQPASAILQ